MYAGGRGILDKKPENLLGRHWSHFTELLAKGKGKIFLHGKVINAENYSPYELQLGETSFTLILL